MASDSASKENAILLLKIKLDLLLEEMRKTTALIKELEKKKAGFNSRNEVQCIKENIIRDLVKNQISHDTLDELKKRENVLAYEVIDIKKKMKELNKINRKSMILIASSLLFFVLTIFFVSGIMYQTSDMQLTSKYVIENLKGDIVDTELSWRLVEGETLHVNIVSSDTVSQDKIDAIKDAIFSEDTIEVDNSLLHKGQEGTTTFYTGWKGALKKASERHVQFYIPQYFSIINSSKGEGDIIITITNLKDADGYTGFTKSITDNNQILKSSITIYESGKLSKEQIGVITRHEFGHALGLAHSNNPLDLMHHVIQTEYPYVSECDIDAIIALYDGKTSSKIVCEK